MVRDGIPFVIVPVVVAIIPLAFGYWWAAIPFLLLAAFMAFFFRDPDGHLLEVVTPGVWSIF